MKTLRKILHNTYHYKEWEFNPQVWHVEVMPGNRTSQRFFVNVYWSAETCLYLPNWCTISIFCNTCITLDTSTCFEHYYAHPQEVKIVFLQHLESSLSMSGHTVRQLRADCSPTKWPNFFLINKHNLRNAFFLYHSSVMWLLWILLSFIGPMW
jgi:hypothetical protein